MAVHIIAFVRKWWHYLIGFAIFAYLISKVDVSATLFVLSSVNPFLVTAAFLMVIPMFVLKAARWKYMMGRQGISYSLKDSVAMYFAAMYLGFVTPGRVAELLKASYLMRDGHSFGKSFFSVFFDRLLDLLFLAIVGYAGLFFFQRLFSHQIFLLSLVAVVEVVVAAVLIAKKGLAKSLLKRLLLKLAPSRHKGSVEVHVEDFYSSLRIFNFRSTAVIAFLTALSYLFYFIMVIMLAEAVGIRVSYWFIIVSIAIASLITIIPISIAGVGTRDASLLLMLGSLGVAREAIIAYSTLNLFANLVVIVMSAPFWFRKPIKF